MKTALLAAACLLLAGVALAPGAAASYSVCKLDPTLDNEVCCAAPSSPTTEYYCSVRDATNTYVGYVAGIALGLVDYTLWLEDCLVNQQPISQWTAYCIPLPAIA